MTSKITTVSVLATLSMLFAFVLAGQLSKSLEERAHELDSVPFEFPTTEFATSTWEFGATVVLEKIPITTRSPSIVIRSQPTPLVLRLAPPVLQAPVVSFTKFTTTSFDFGSTTMFLPTPSPDPLAKDPAASKAAVSRKAAAASEKAADSKKAAAASKEAAAASKKAAATSKKTNASENASSSKITSTEKNSATQKDTATPKNTAIPKRDTAAPEDSPSPEGASMPSTLVTVTVTAKRPTPTVGHSLFERSTSEYKGPTTTTLELEGPSKAASMSEPTL
jgi:hypothetical protein